MKYLNKLNEAIKDSDVRITDIDNCTAYRHISYDDPSEVPYVWHDINGIEIPFGNYIKATVSILIPIDETR